MAGTRKLAGTRHEAAARARAKARNSQYDIVAIGASAGGLFAVSEVLRALPPDFPASVVIVQHLSPRHKSNLSELLARVTRLPVAEARDDMRLATGTVYIAPPDEHLLVENGKLCLAHSQAVGFLRPSIDLLFDSVAKHYGKRAVALVLSGALRDGSNGVCSIKKAGGMTMAEDPVDAEFPSMPLSAVSTGCINLVVPLVEIGATLVRLCVGEQKEHGG